ncbi:hypothetical protein MTR_7g056100 [Medicago truncatula]|uniref:Uncharacterized protein n=1 Tax=Medicago truncatula TaxID=3880 RepID=A0A072U0E4_MEDTR|nr:hypothetical protein MTR_7g056100 [Medicago truncatula]
MSRAVFRVSNRDTILGKRATIFWLAGQDFQDKILKESLKRDKLEKSNESDIFIKLLSLEKVKVPNLERPFFTCKPATLISQFYQYIAFETSLQTEEIELFVVKECNPNIIFGDANLDPSNMKFEFLTREEETSFAEIIPNNLIRGYLVIAYKKKVWDLNVALC